MFMSKLEATTFNPWLNLVRPVLEGLPEQAFEKSASLTAQWLEFLNWRVQADVELWTSLVRCKTPQDVQRAYADFGKTAWAQYQEYVRALAGTALPEREIVPVLGSDAKYKAAA
jgi:phasin protein